MYSLRFFKNKEDYTNNKDSFLESTVSFVNDEEKTYFKLDPLTIVSFKVQLDYDKSLVAASGDTITPFVTYTQVMMDANGVNTTISGDSNTLNSSVTISYISDIEGFNSNNGVIAVPSRGTELGDKITLGSVKAVVTINGVSASDTEIISQEENVILTTISEGGETIWGDVNLPIIEDSYIPANGGSLSVSIPTALQGYTVTDTVTTFKYASQATSSITTTNNGGEVVVLPSKLIVKASAENKNITPSDITEVYSETVTWLGNDGKSASYDVTIYQEANTIAETSYEGGVVTYGAIEGVNYTEFTIPASGGSGVTVMSNARQPYSVSEFKRVDTYSSNEKKYTTISAATTDVKIVTPSIVELSGESNSKGVIVSDKNVVTSATVTWNGENNEIITKEVYVYQQENRVINESVTNGEIIYGDVIPGNITNAIILASGGSAISEATNGTQEWTTDASTVIYLYTSGEEEEVEMSDSKGGINIILPSVPYLTADALSKGRVESDQTIVDQVLVEWIGNDNKKASDTMYVHQEANKLISTEYSVPSGVSVKVNDIPASGGSINNGVESGDISQTVTYTYTSGVYSDEINPSYTIAYNNVVSSNDLKDKLTERTLVGELEYTYTSNGKSTTSKVGVYQEANELEESYSEYEYGKLVRGTISNKVIAASGGSAEATATNGSQTYTATTHNIFTSGEYLSVNEGTSVIKPYPSSLKGSALSRGIVVGGEKEVISSRVTWSSMDNSQVLEDTLVITQEANVETIDDVTITYDDIRKGNVSVTPQVVSATGGTAIVSATVGKQDFEEVTTYIYTSKSSRTAVTNSGTLDVNPVITPSALTFTEIAATATTAPTKSSTVTWSLNGKTATSNVSATQELKRLVDSGTTYTYGNVTKGTITEATIDASGGTATTTIGNGKQPYTSVTWYEYHTGEVLEDAPKTGTNNVAPSQKTLVGEAESKKITVSDVTIVTEKDITWSGNDNKSATAVARVYQEANVRTLSDTEVLYKYGAIEKGNVNGISIIPASGGSVTVTATTGSQAYTAYTAVTYIHTSNESLTTTEGEKADVQTLQPSIATWTVTADTRGIISGNVKAISSTTITWLGGGDKSDSTNVTINQQANEITGTTGGNFTYSEVTVGELSVSNVIPASGGSATVTATNGKQTITTSEVTVGYTSGAIEETDGERSQTVDIAPSAVQTVVTADTRGTVTGNIQTVRTVTIYYGGQGSKSNSTSIDVKQAKNAITATTYGTPSGLTLSVNDIHASGGTISEGVIGGTCQQKYTYSYDAGKDLSSTTKTVTYSGNYTNSVNAASLGKTIKARTSVGTLNYSYTANGKSNTVSATVYQALNKVTSVSGTGNPTISYNVIPANGGTVSPSNSGFSARFYYSSGSYGDPDGYSAVRTYSGGSTNANVLTLNTSNGQVSASSRGTTSGASLSRTIKTTITYSYTNPSSVGGGSVSTAITATGSATQAENKKTARSEVAYNYADFKCGTISASPMTIPVGGGVSNISTTNGSEKWSAITTYDYSSGDHSTAVTNTGTSTITPSISPSNGKLEFSDNSGNGSEVTKTATATWVGESDSCTNSVSVTQSSRTLTATTTGNTYGSYSYGNVVCGDIVLSQTSVGAGETVRVTASTTKGSQSWSRPYSAYTYYHYDDGTTDTVYSGKSTQYGSDDIVGSVSPSYYDFSDRGTVTGAAITKTFTGTWNGVGDSCTTTKSVSQEANALEGHVVSGSVAYTYGTVSVGEIYSPTAPASGTNGQSLFATAGNGSQPYTAVTTYKDTYTSTSTAKTTSTSTGTASITPVKSDGGSGIDYGRAVTSLGCTATTEVTVAHSRTVYYRSLDGVSSKDKSATMYIYQEANTYTTSSTPGTDYGTKTYATPSCGTITLSQNSVGAGETVRVTATIGNGTQTWSRTVTPYTSYTYTHKSGCVSTGRTNGTAYSDTGSTSVSCTVSPTYYDFSNRGTTTGNTITKTFTGTCTANGKTGTTTKSVSQEANKVVSAWTTGGGITYGNLTNTSCGYPSDIPASGGEVCATGSTAKQVITTAATYSWSRYTSGSEASAKTDSGGSSTKNITPNTLPCCDGDDLGCTAKARTLICTSTVTWTGYGGKTASCTCNCYQEQNKVVSAWTTGGGVTYGNLTNTSCGYPSDIPCYGGEVCATGSTAKQVITTAATYSWSAYTSGSECSAKTDSGGSSTKSISPDTLPCCEANSLGTTYKSSRTLICTSTVTWSGYGGKTASCTCKCYQEANTYTTSVDDTGTSCSTKSYGSVVCGSISVSTTSLPASGGTVTASKTNGRRSWTRNCKDWTAYTDTYCSGSKDSYTTYGSVYTDSGTDTITCTLNRTSYTFSNPGCTKDSGASVEFTLTCNGSICDRVTVYRAANTSSSTTSETTTYGAVTAGAINNATIPASGGSATATAGNGKQSYTSITTTTYTFASGCETTKDKSSSGTSSVSPSTASLLGTASSRGTTTGNSRNITSTTVTWSGGGNKKASGTMSVNQDANYADVTVDVSYPSYLACNECAFPSASVTISYSSGSEIYPSGGVTFSGGGFLSGPNFCYDDPSGNEQTSSISATYSGNGVTGTGRGPTISLGPWTC